MQRTLRRMALTLLERTGTPAADLCLVGIRNGGVPLAERLSEAIADTEGHSPKLGAVDIGLYRDDAATALPSASIGPGDIQFSIAGKQVVLVDDVIQTGRTIRAAIDCLLDYGRPNRIWLAVLFDRGGRELPIHPDVTGKDVTVPVGAKLDVQLQGPGPDRAVLETIRPPKGTP